MKGISPAIIAIVALIIGLIVVVVGIGIVGKSEASITTNVRMQDFRSCCQIWKVTKTNIDCRMSEGDPEKINDLAAEFGTTVEEFCG
jgi:hypothetical protein